MPRSARLLAALALLPAACGQQRGPETEVTVTEAVAFAPLGRGAQALVGTTERAILDADTWDAFADSLRPLFPFDSVSFDREMVLVAALQVPHGGYDLRFELVEQTGDTLRAAYRVYVPGEDCRSTVGPGAVFHAVRLGRSGAIVEFARESEAIDCTPPR